MKATLVHISDLHFGWWIDRMLLPQLKDLIKEIAPQFLVASGDLVENPFPRSMRKASEYIASLARECGIPGNCVLVIPGNHDYKVMGNVGLRRLSRIPFEVYFRMGGLNMSRGARLGSYAYLILNALWPWGKRLYDRLEIIENDELGVAIFGFNSTPLFQMFGMATGKVQGGQISALASRLAKQRLQLETAVKIAVVHHHPLPIPYVSTGLKARLEESLMVFYNAGTFLRELGRCGVDLVLHGHKHFAGFTRVAYDLPGGIRHQMGVLAAGSTTRKGRTDPLGNQFNVIRIYDDETVDIEQWFYSYDVRRKEESRTYTLCGIDDVRARRLARLRRKSGLTLREVQKKVTLTADGYSSIRVELKQCQACTVDGVASYDVDLTTPRPSYIREFKVIPGPNTPRFLSVKLDEKESHLRRLKGTMFFGETRQIGDGAFDLSYSYKLMNAHALSLQEFERKYMGKNLEWEYASFECEDATETLKLAVEFPDEFDALTYGAEVLYLPSTARGRDPKDLDWRDEKRHEEETGRIKSAIRRPDYRRIELEVASPVPGLIYRIRWNYENQRSSIRHTTRLAEGLLLCVRARLIESARQAAEGRPDRVQETVQALLAALLDDVEQRHPPCDPEERLTISLSVFDDSESVLRFVAANFGSMAGLFDETFVPGEGCAGFSFEKQRGLFYHCARDENRYYVTPQEAARDRGQQTALGPHEVVIIVPWVDPARIPMGVISIGSESRCSRLLRIFDMENVEQEAEMNVLIGLTNRLGEAIIAAIMEEREG